jgi:hypothetical protein
MSAAPQIIGKQQSLNAIAHLLDRQFGERRNLSVVKPSSHEIKDLSVGVVLHGQRPGELTGGQRNSPEARVVDQPMLSLDDLAESSGGGIGSVM